MADVDSECGMPALGLSFIAMALREMVKDGEITEEEAAEEIKRIKEKGHGHPQIP